MTTDAELADAAARWREVPALALDTEFVRERTFYARLGLVQICDGRATYLVDPLPLRSFEPLAAILADPRVRKITHSASEDVEVLWHATHAVPGPLFDTQIAAGLAGLPPGLGYQKLVRAVIGVELFKGETRTDWLRRPLSPAQLHYAVEDVTCLLASYHVLCERLVELGRLEWALEDGAELLATERFTPRPLESWQRFRGAGRLKPRQLAALQALAAWRDEQARRRDLPRSFVIKDDVLMAIASRMPADAVELGKIPGFDARQAARDGAALAAILEETAALPESSLPVPPPPPPATPEARALERALREVAQRRAADLGVAPEVLVTRRPIEALVRSALENGLAALPPELEGWRRAVVGEALLERARRRPVG